MEVYRAAFGDDGPEGPTHASVASGRVNLIGEHTDYSGGLVLPIAIDRWCVAVGAIVPDGDGLIRVVSDGMDGNGVATFDARELAVGGPGGAGGAGEGGRGGGVVWHGKGWRSYVAGVIAHVGMEMRAGGGRLPGMCIALAGNVPLGAGLSSSAAFEVSLAGLMLEMLGGSGGAGGRVEMRAVARIARAAERGYAGVPCGIMDQLASACAIKGHALLIDCRSEETAHVPLDSIADLEVLVIDSGVKHALVEGAYAERAAGCARAAELLGVPTLREATLELIEARRGDLLEAGLGGQDGDALLRYARHVVTENARVEAFVRALREPNGGEVHERARRERLGELMRASHASLRDDFRVSCAELDTIVEAAGAAPGVVGCRMTGGGFGGSAIALVERGKAEVVAARVDETMKDRFGSRFGAGPRSFKVTPSAGARAWRIGLSER